MRKKQSVFTILLFYIILSTAAISQEKPDEKYYLIRCDDIGMCHSINLAAKRVIDAGIPVSVSVMFVCPWYQEAVEMLKSHPEVSVGIHLTLNSEWKNYRWGPVLGKSAVPSLVDSAGYFFPSRAELFANDPKAVEVEKELRAQINRAILSGLCIDYIDCHMSAAVTTIELRRIVEKIADEFGWGMSGYFHENYSSITFRAPFGSKADSLLDHVRHLEPCVNLQVMHIGLNTSEMRALVDMNTFGLKEISRHRAEELESLLDARLPKLWEKLEIKPITYRNLIEIVGLENMSRPELKDY